MDFEILWKDLIITEDPSTVLTRNENSTITTKIPLVSKVGFIDIAHKAKTIIRRSPLILMIMSWNKETHRIVFHFVHTQNGKENIHDVIEDH